jgi:hypothetical protein
MVFNATINNISVISWQSVLLVEEIGGPGEDKEKENFYRIITLIMDQGTKAKRELLKCYLATENITLQYFLSMQGPGENQRPVAKYQ